MSGGPRRPAGSPPRRFATIVTGVMLLGRGRAEGFGAFANTAQAFLSSLAPLIAFPLAGTLLALANGEGLDALRAFLATLCALLAPPVLSHLVASRYGVADRWPRFAAAFNWCQWLIPVLAIVMMAAMSGAMALGLPAGVAGGAVLFALAGYGLWLHWFLARRGLGLSRGRAAVLVVLVNAGTIALLVLPDLLDLWRGK